MPIRYLRFDKFGQKFEQFLPAEITGFGGDSCRNAFLDDVQIRAAKDLFERNGRLKFTGHVRIIEFVRVTNTLVRCQIKVDSAEGMAFADAEIGKGHVVTGAYAGVQAMDFAGKAVWRQPFGQCVGVQEGLINLLRGGAEDAVQADGI